MAEFADLAEKRAQTTHIPVVRQPALTPRKPRGTNAAIIKAADPIGLHFGLAAGRGQRDEERHDPAPTLAPGLHACSTARHKNRYGALPEL